MKLIRRVVELAANALGLELIAKWRTYDKPLADTLREMFGRLQISTVLDIGANEGQYYEFLRQHVGFTGIIHSFEPDPDLADKLIAKSAIDPKWKIHPVALGPSPGKLEMNIMNTPVFNSFLAPSKDQPRLGENHDLNSNAVRTSVLVEVKTLDDVTTELADLKTTYVKIDTQGFDLQVLAGGPRTVNQIPALQTEVSFRSLYVGSPTFQESLEAFGKAGFSVVDFFLVVSDHESMAAVEFDCVMVRSHRTPPAVQTATA
ncbi:MAG TPA: FkbM family methyltransferase [Candidatus Aquilonibacter sp.]|nr:FkbM family methyltransferase [Candidatus Aquilonibacter sp.]